jgi:hypothetical protein
VQAQLELGLQAQREVAEALAEHFAERDDERGMFLLDALLDVQIALLKQTCEAWREVKGISNGNRTSK